jgi:hypothetical protein
VVIAVIDSGADWTHPDLAPNLVMGWNFLTGTTTGDNEQVAYERHGVAPFRPRADALGQLAIVADDAGRLCRCTEAYDRKVAGIVSGAGALKPGIVLGRDGVAGRSRPIALAGRVNCQVDARYGPVEVGSLLTTSSTPGHAMRAVDERRAFGAVIGKALAPLAAGQALVPILVALQ